MVGPRDLSMGASTVRMVVDAIRVGRGLDLRDFTPIFLSHRLYVMIREMGLQDATQLVRLIRSDDEIYQRALELLFPRTTEMFRDPVFWQAMRRALRERLVDRFEAPLRIWVAGYDSGEELYSLLVLLEQLGLRKHCVVYCSYLSARVRDQVQSGIMDISTKEVDEINFSRYAEAGASLDDYVERIGRHRALRKDLLQDVEFIFTPPAFPAWELAPVHLVHCRNSLIYYARRQVGRNMQTLSNALLRGGLLTLGMGERLENLDKSSNFIAENEQVRIYRRRA